MSLQEKCSQKEVMKMLEYVKKENGTEFTIEYFTAMNGKTLDCKIYRGHRQPRTDTQPPIEGHLLVSYYSAEDLDDVKQFISDKFCRGSELVSKDQSKLEDFK